MPITLFRCIHGPKQLNERFEELFKECDILFEEHGISDYRDELNSYLSELANKGYAKKISAKDRNSFIGDYNKKLDYFVRDSGKKIEIEISPISMEELKKNLDLSKKESKTFLKGDVEKACKQTLEKYKRFNQLTKRRDENFIRQLTKLQEENKGKNILSVIGANHTIYYKLKEMGLNVREDFPQKPFLFPLHAEIRRRIKFNKPFTNEMVARTFVESFLTTYLYKSGLPLYESNIKSRNIAEKLSYEDIESLSKYLSEKSYRKSMFKEATVLWLRKKGFDI
jgi:hypothetical protein